MDLSLFSKKEGKAIDNSLTVGDPKNQIYYF
jgi:hypothetical protein